MLSSLTLTPNHKQWLIKRAITVKSSLLQAARDGTRTWYLLASELWILTTELCNLNQNTSQCLLLYVSLWRWNAQGQLFRAHCKNILTNAIELGGSLQILYLKKPTQNYYFSRSVKNNMKGNEDKCHVHFP